MTANSTPSFDVAGPADFPAIRDLLSQAQLPVEDLSDATPIRFWVVRRQGNLIGTVALERYGNVAMLRSLAVRPGHRGNGLGLALLHKAERGALDEGIGTLCLLTTTAADLFARHGYVRIARNDAPEAVRRSEEFRSLCPDSAICMLKHLVRVEETSPLD